MKDIKKLLTERFGEPLNFVFRSLNEDKDTKASEKKLEKWNKDHKLAASKLGESEEEEETEE